MALTPTTQRVLFYGSVTLFLLGALRYTTAMPGHSHAGPLQPPSAHALDGANELRSHVSRLAEVIGERRVGQGDSLEDARDYVASELRKLAGTGPSELTFEDLGADGSSAKNVILELPGQAPEIVLVGAHYDSAPDTRGANDNASGVAVACSWPSV